MSEKLRTSQKPGSSSLTNRSPRRPFADVEAPLRDEPPDAPAILRGKVSALLLEGEHNPAPGALSAGEKS